MRTFSLLLSLACLATATPLFEGQAPLGAELMTSYPGYSLDLSAQRLVQLEDKEPTWISELDKVKLKAKGVKFFDM
ncbi:hypothetical protein H0H92_004853 [Tricholoma furcatifolium]|nr:hypothetical protein H0H92_004853 [Tricholoma furcatifolium]